MEILGIDIGGTGIKGAPVDVVNGTLKGERFRIPTPKPAKPQAVANVVREIVKHFSWRGPIGITFPGVVKRGIVVTAPNLDSDWIGVDGQQIFQKATACSVTILNDADAAGIAEMHFGAGKGKNGVVLMVTLGTGIGTALFLDGSLVPNSELGHLEIRGKDSERRASDRARELKNLSWKKWAGNVSEYLEALEKFINPDLFIIGGGVSKKGDKFIPLLKVNTKVMAAKLLNEAGIVGAALAVEEMAAHKPVVSIRASDKARPAPKKIAARKATRNPARKSKSSVRARGR